ncbi:hypothetical protein ES704_02760 [subsurface metagenome]
MVTQVVDLEVLCPVCQQPMELGTTKSTKKAFYFCPMHAQTWVRREAINEHNRQIQSIQQTEEKGGKNEREQINARSPTGGIEQGDRGEGGSRGEGRTELSPALKRILGR